MPTQVFWPAPALLTKGITHMNLIPTDKRGRKVGAAALITLGAFGIVTTVAAFNSSATFNADASANEVKVSAAYDATAFVPATAGEVSITLPAALFANLDQGDSRTTNLKLKNDGPTELVISTADIALTGALFAGAAPATVAFVDAEATAVETVVIGAGQTVDFDVTLATPAGWADSYQGGTGTATVEFEVIANN